MVLSADLPSTYHSLSISSSSSFLIPLPCIIPLLASLIVLLTCVYYTAVRVIVAAIYLLRINAFDLNIGDPSKCLNVDEARVGPMLNFICALSLLSRSSYHTIPSLLTTSTRMARSALMTFLDPHILGEVGNCLNELLDY